MTKSNDSTWQEEKSPEIDNHLASFPAVYSYVTIRLDPVGIVIVALADDPEAVTAAKDLDTKTYVGLIANDASSLFSFNHTKVK